MTNKYLVLPPYLLFLCMNIGAICASRLPLLTQNEGRSHANTTLCRCLPAQECWPTSTTWEAFNQTLGGKLIATKPLASSCHLDEFEEYSEKDCESIQAAWSSAETHLESSSSIMAPFFSNYSCDPFSPKSSHCIVGNYVQYAVNASGAADYQRTINFVRKYNLRLTIRNTGHDYYGKATGAGAVAIWTHHLKNTNIVDYTSSYYNGKAIKVGAGVSVMEAMTAANSQGLVVVGGNEGNVGFAGGYTQGGGHGQLVSKYGLAADQVLEWEVITGNGDLLIASPTENKDLYWALSGGGGGSYGVVLSMTSRAYPDERTAAANLTFTNEGVSQDTFFEVVETFINTLPALVDAKAVSVWLMTNSSFAMTPASGIGLASSELADIMRPTIAKLEKHLMKYTYFVGDFPTFLDAFKVMNPPNPVNNIQIGGRFIPRSLVESRNESKALMVALRDISNKVGAISGIALDASKKKDHIDNSVHPQWRNVLFDAVVGTYWSNNDTELNIANQDLVTYDVIPQLERLTPGGGAYLSEGDFRQPNWQHVFYGSNYERLTGIKLKYDPHELFYALTGIGSDSWTVEGDGALCKIA